MITITNKEECCGCCACVQACPKECIIATVDNEGFLYPEIDLQKCVNCGICENVCPIICKQDELKIMPDCLVAYAKDDTVRKNSSSGGLFWTIASDILKYAGVVYGAAFDQDFLVHHVRISSIEELKKIQGSKYLQSRIERTFEECKADLEKNKIVLFSGTPCQIAGLKKFLQKEYTTLYTVDILCHGVPSPLIWSMYLHDLKGKRKIKRINFRSKTYGWNNYALKIEYTNGSTKESLAQTNRYMRMFLENICLRPSCHACRFKSLNRCADITLGDCWRINKSMPGFDENKGTSIILVHSSKGQELVNRIQEQIIYNIGEIDTLLPESSDSRKVVVANPRREEFFDKINSGVKISRACKLVNVPLLLKFKSIKCKFFILKKDNFFKLLL